MPVSVRHQLIASFLGTLLLWFVQERTLGIVLLDGVMMRLRAEGPTRVPDIMFVAEKNLSRLGVNRLDGPADLIVEFVSEESRYRDRVDKFFDYETGGVREYLLIDPRQGNERVDLYRLGADGKYLAVLPDEHGRYHLASLPGFWFDPAWFWQEPIMKIKDALVMILPEGLGDGIARPPATSAEGANG